MRGKRGGWNPSNGTKLDFSLSKLRTRDRAFHLFQYNIKKGEKKKKEEENVDWNEDCLLERKRSIEIELFFFSFFFIFGFHIPANNERKVDFTCNTYLKCFEMWSIHFVIFISIFRFCYCLNFFLLFIDSFTRCFEIIHLSFISN